VADEHPQAWLLVVGPDEDGLRAAAEKEAGQARSRIRWVGLTGEPQRYHAAADVLALPSYREGFGNVIIEAAAAGVPAVASRIYGIEDALADGETGLMHAPGDVPGLAGCLSQLIADPALRARLGARALERARRDFSSETVNAFWLEYLGRRLG
jgi:glycosyltransferase involved in cell wall biosynthesis